MKNQKVLFYIFKWLAWIFLAYLTIKESHSILLTILLIGYVSTLLIWEGFKDFRPKSNHKL